MAKHRPGTHPARANDRGTNSLPLIRKRFLIVCEGEKTEPNYFRSFEAARRVVTVRGTGFNTLSLVDEAIRVKREEEETLRRHKLGRFSQCWCVFDRDGFPAADFNSAIQKAQAAGFHVAYSNESFELWYVLHFHYHNAQATRGAYCDTLNTLFPKGYQKNSATLYAQLLPKQKAAIRHAKRLLASHRNSPPEQCNPSTTVHLLVEALNKSLGILPTP